MKDIKEFLVYKITRAIYHWSTSPLRNIACIIRVITNNHSWDKKLGIKTAENSPIQEDITVFKDSVTYMPTPYHVIERVFSQLQFSYDDVFIDLGCGKGRVVLFAAIKKLKKVIGIEAYKDMFDIAVDNLKKLKIKNTPVEIVKADAAMYDMKEGTIFFMFNPFGINTEKRVMENIRKSLEVNPRQVRIICYYGPNICSINGCDKWLTLEKRYFDIPVDIWRSNI